SAPASRAVASSAIRAGSAGLRGIEDFPRAAEHAVPHRARQEAGAGVLPAGMIRGDQDGAVREAGVARVTEDRTLARRQAPDPAGGAEIALVGDATERHHHAQAAERRELGFEVRLAAVELDRRGSVLRRRAAARGGDIAVEEPEPVP